MEIETEVKKLLKHLYTEAASNGADAKKVKFSDMKEEVGHLCPSSSITCSPMQSAKNFQMYKARIETWKEVTLIHSWHGQVRQSSSTAAGSDDTFECLRLALKKSDEIQCQNAVLHQRSEDLQQQNDDLQKEVDELRQREHSLVSTTILDSQIGQLLSN